VKRPNAKWVENHLAKFCKVLLDDVAGDCYKSCWGPQYLIECNRPMADELKKNKKDVSLAARARALDYKMGISDEALIQLIVELDEF
jgi:hypothetical protein